MTMRLEDLYLDDNLCRICGRELNVDSDPLSVDCGGDCVKCMAEAGDPDCVEHVRRILESLIGS